MPLDGFSYGRSALRTVTSMMVASVVVPPARSGFTGPDAGLLAAQAEVGRLLALGNLGTMQQDRVEQLDDWLAFHPAAGLDGAIVKLGRLLCPAEGLFSGRGLRINGADEAALRDIARIVNTAKCSRVNTLGRGAR